jgi:hypothetical protein
MDRENIFMTQILEMLLSNEMKNQIKIMEIFKN